MHRRLIALSLLAAAAVGGVARADDAFEVTGRIATPNPLTKRLNGVTETANPCGTPDPQFGDLNGLDGFWIALPFGAPRRTAIMESTGLDADVWFYASSPAGCHLIGVTEDPAWAAMATPLTGSERGTVPAGATHAIVDLAAGNGATLTFRLL